jgi:hypothetical protein
MSEVTIAPRVVPVKAATVPVRKFHEIPRGHATKRPDEDGSRMSVKGYDVRVFPDLSTLLPRAESLHEDHGPAVGTIRDGKLTIELAADQKKPTLVDLEPMELFRFAGDDRGIVRLKTDDGWVTLAGWKKGVSASFDESGTKPQDTVIRLDRLEVQVEVRGAK